MDDPIRNDLDAIQQAREGALRASARPWWVDAIAAVGVGAAIPLVLTLQPVLIVVGILLGAAAISWAISRERRRDQAPHSGRPSAVRFVLILLFVMAPIVVSGFLLEPDSPLWAFALSALAVTVGSFAFLRLEQRQQLADVSASGREGIDLP